MTHSHNRTALYLRLSKDDEGAGESSSITNQRQILQDYAAAHQLTVVGEYVDDGYSGTNYDRPAFRRMMDDIEAGAVNCVLTKDLSRLGRNSARTSDLLDEYFPSRGIRYISVIDGYDSLHLTSGSMLTAPLMMAMHELYARDISCKIRTSFRSKMENGEYIGSFAPYGYQKDESNKNHLVADEQTAPIVQEIFQMAAEGHPPGEIARYLNAKDVATPAAYRCFKRPYLGPDHSAGRRDWTSSILCKMLRNTVYLGHTSQGKTSKISFKSSITRPNRREDWIVVKNTHTPLITEETFRLVQTRSVARRRPPAKGFENIFSGIARCADCGRTMTTAPSGKKGARLCCGGYKSHGASACSNHFIDYDVLYHGVLRELQQWLAFPREEKDTLRKALAQEPANRKEQGTNGKGVPSCKQLERRIQEVTFLMKQLYEDYTAGRVSEVLYRSLTEEYEAELFSLTRTLEEKNRLNPSKRTACEESVSLLNELTELTVLSKPLLRALIDRIEVEQGAYIQDETGARRKQQRVKIYYRFRNWKQD